MTNWYDINENDFDTMDYNDLNESGEEIGYTAISRALMDQYETDPEDFITYLKN